MRPIKYFDPSKSRQGFLTVAVFLCLAFAVLVISTTANLTLSTLVLHSAYDNNITKRNEAKGLSQLVTESVLEKAQTQTAPQSASLESLLGQRLSQFTFGTNVTYGIKTAAEPAANSFYPFTPSPATTTAPVNGFGMTIARFTSLGPYSDLAAGSVAFSRSISGAIAESTTVTVDYRLFSIPWTNSNLICYGLRSTGSVPSAAPTMAPGFFSSGISRLIMTTNTNSDPTVYTDLLDPNTPNSAPYHFSNNVIFTWDTAEYLWSTTYSHALVAAAGTGGFYNLPSAINPSIAGISRDGNTVTVNLSQIVVPLLVINDYGSTSTEVVITGTTTSTAPLFIYARNLRSGTMQIRISGTNTRPVFLMCVKVGLSFAGNPNFAGAIVLDPNSTASGQCTIFGHVSFYHANSPFPAWALSLREDAPTKIALASISPRVVLAGTNFSLN